MELEFKDGVVIQFGTERTDSEGVSLIDDWMASLEEVDVRLGTNPVPEWLSSCQWFYIRTLNTFSNKYLNLTLERLYNAVCKYLHGASSSCPFLCQSRLLHRMADGIPIYGIDKEIGMFKTVVNRELVSCLPGRSCQNGREIRSWARSPGAALARRRRGDGLSLWRLPAEPQRRRHFVQVCHFHSLSKSQMFTVHRSRDTEPQMQWSRRSKSKSRRLKSLSSRFVLCW